MITKWDLLKINAKEMLKHSKLEYTQYEKTGEIVYLQQAGEKLFNAFSRYLEIKYNVITTNHDDIRMLSTRDQRNFDLMSKMDALHEFFYHGGMSEAHGYAKKTYNEVVKSLENRINAL